MDWQANNDRYNLYQEHIMAGEPEKRAWYLAYQAYPKPDTYLNGNDPTFVARKACYEKHLAEGKTEKHSWYLAFQEHPRR